MQSWVSGWLSRKGAPPIAAVGMVQDPETSVSCDLLPTQQEACRRAGVRPEPNQLRHRTGNRGAPQNGKHHDERPGGISRYR
jgi:hypothetical protein